MKYRIKINNKMSNKNYDILDKINKIREDYRNKLLELSLIIQQREHITKIDQLKLGVIIKFKGEEGKKYYVSGISHNTNEVLLYPFDFHPDNEFCVLQRVWHPLDKFDLE